MANDTNQPKTRRVRMPRYYVRLFLGVLLVAAAIFITIQLVYVSSGRITRNLLFLNLALFSVIILLVLGTAYLLVRRAILRQVEYKLNLEDANALTESILNSLPDAFHSFDLEGKPIKWNKAAREITGYSDEEIASMSAADFVSEEDRQGLESTMAEALGGGRGLSYEATVITRDGRRIPFEFSGSLLTDQDGNVVGFGAMGRDVTERKRAEKELKESGEQYKDLYDKAPNAYFSVGADGFIKMANQTAAEMIGCSIDELIGKPVLELYADTSFGKAKARKTFEKFKSGEEIRNEEMQMKKSSGEPVWISLSVSSVRDKKGNVVESRSVVVDITEQKQAEEKRELLLRELGERVKELNCLYGLARLVEKPNISLEEILEGLVEIMPPTWQYPDITCSRVLLGETEYETDNFRGTEWIQIADIMVFGNKEGSLEVCYLEEMPESYEGPFLAEERDLIDALAERLGRVIERMRGEQQLVAAKERWERSFKGVGEGMFIIDADFTVLQCNEAFANLVGDKPENLVGRKCYELVHNLDGPPDSCVTNAAVIEGRSASAELYEPNLGRYLEVLSDPSLDSKGNFDFAIHLARDITERKRKEEEVQRINVELEGFAHTVSHDLRGPLTVITLASHNLREVLKLPRTDENELEIEELTEMIGSSVDRSSGLIEDLLTLAESGQAPSEVSDVDVGEIVERVLEERAGDIEEKEITVKVDDDLGQVMANPTQTYQLFSNLIGNAIKHNDSRKPVIEVSYLGDDELGAHRYLVRDNGSGVPPEELDKIFIPFFKGETGETGIGLSTVEKIVKVYGGEIRAYNDNGACFEFTLTDYE